MTTHNKDAADDTAAPSRREQTSGIDTTNGTTDSHIAQHRIGPVVLITDIPTGRAIVLQLRHNTSAVFITPNEAQRLAAALIALVNDLTGHSNVQRGTDHP